MRRLIADHDIESVWFGAAAPLALLAPQSPQRRSGPRHRQHARPRGGLVDAAGGPQRAAPHRGRHRRRDLRQPLHPRPVRLGVRARMPRWNTCRRGWTPTGSRPIRLPARRCGRGTGSATRPVVVCLSRLVPRKGQDMLIRALPAIRERVDGAALVIVGGGPYLATLHRLARQARRRRVRDLHRRRARRRTARPPRDGRRVRDAVPHPRRGPGRRGPRHRLSGGVGDGCAGRGRPLGWRARDRCATARRDWWWTAGDVDEIATAVGEILADPDRAAAMGAAGAQWVVDNWQWRYQGGAPGRAAGRRLARAAFSP